MRLAILNQFYIPDLSPTAHLAASLAEHRAARGDTVTVVTGRGGYHGGAAASAAQGDNPAIRRVWTPALGKVNLTRRLLDYASFFTLAATAMARLPAQDVIVTMTTPPFIGLAAALHRQLHRRTRLVLWSMDVYPDAAEIAGAIRPQGAISRALRGVNRWLYRRCDAWVALDEAMADRLRVYAPAGADIQVIPNWERAADFPPEFLPEPWAPAAALNRDGKFVMLYGGNAGEGHRFETVIAAARRLRDEPVLFLFVGGGSQYAWIAQAAADLPNVVLQPHVPKAEMANVLASADCALITMRDEMAGVVSPSKLHSALAMRLPVLYIGPEAGNVHEAVIRHGCGISLRHGDVDGAVAFIRELMHGVTLDYSDAARKAFDAAYCDRVALARFDALLDRLHSVMAEK